MGSGPSHDPTNADLVALLGVIGGEPSALGLDPDAAERVVDLAIRHGVDGLIPISSEAAKSTLSMEIRKDLAGRSMKAEHRRSILDQALADALSLLAEADVSVMVLKGWWTSRTVYDDPIERRFGDIDLWVHPQAPVTTGELAAILAPSAGHDSDAIDRSLEADLVHNFAVNISRCHVELHKNPYGLKVDPPDLVWLWNEHAVETSFCGHRLFEPSLELGLAVACVNYTRDCFPLIYQLLDVHRLSTDERLDWDRFWRLCEQQQIAAFAHGALALAARRFGAPMPPQVQVPTGWRRWWTADGRVLRGESPVAARVPALLLMPKGVRNTVRIARTWLFPSRGLIWVWSPKFRLDTADPHWLNVVRLNRRRFEEMRRAALSGQSDVTCAAPGAK